ncbi:hypothetical protein NECID01_1733 [Nematocida sp. AWRm77]|nr:hypothetical protein NECID01_1733 [Nematocida sp. AWRm77]
MRGHEVEKLLALSVDPSKRKEAEDLSRNIDGSVEEATALLEKIIQTQEPIQSMGGIFLKRSLQQMENKTVPESVWESVLEESARASLACSYRTHLLLCESISIAGRKVACGAVEETVAQIDPEEKEYGERTVRLFNVIRAYAEKYRTESASEKLYLDILRMLQQVGEKLVQVCRNMAYKKRSPEMYCTVLELFVSLISQDLPDFIEARLEVFVRAAMECADISREEDVLLMISVLEMVSTRYIDAIEDPGVFLNHAIGVFSQIETMYEDVQCVFLQYFTSLLRNPMLEHFLAVHKDYVVNLLVSRVSYFEDMDEAIEFARSFFHTDRHLQRYVACDMLRDLIETDPGVYPHLVKTEKNVKSLFYLTAYLMRGKECIEAKDVICVLEMAQECIVQYKPFDPVCVEEREESVFCAAGVLAMALSSGRYKVKTEESLLHSCLGIISSLKQQSYLLYMAAKLISLVAERLPDQSMPAERSGSGVLFLLGKTLASPPNEFLSPALFELVRISRCNLFPILEEARKKLLSTVETSGSLEEAKGLWDVLSLGAVSQDEKSRKLVFETSKECLFLDATDWFVFSLQSIALCVLFSSDRAYLEYLETLVGNKELWGIKELFESLSFCVLALYYRSPAQHSATVESAFAFLSAYQDRSSFLFMRYLPNGKILDILAGASKVTPDVYLGCFRVCLGKEMYRSVMEKSLQSFLRHPIVQEQDTSFYISLLSSSDLYAEPFAQQHRAQLQTILKRLAQREKVMPKKEEYKKLALIEDMFIKLRAAA